MKKYDRNVGRNQISAKHMKTHILPFDWIAGETNELNKIDRLREKFKR